MKKALISVIMVLSLATALYAAGSAIVITYSTIGVNSGMSDLTYTWTTDDSAGSVYTSSGVNLTTISGLDDIIAGKNVVMVITDPTDTPSDNYEVFLRDAYGVDIMGAAMINCDQTDSEQWLPLVGSLSSPRPLSAAPILEVTTAGNSKNGVIHVILSRQH